MNVFVTVGTTNFDKLIKTVTSHEILHLLKNLGYANLTLQIGNGKYEPQKSDSAIKVDFYRFKPDLVEDLTGADLVISHGGAGSCLEVLNMHKRLIAVINEDLMGNHQLELCTQLAKRGYMCYCTCGELAATLTLEQTPKQYPAAEPKLFADYINKCMGFVEQ